MKAGAVVRAADVRADRTGTGAVVRTLIGPADGTGLVRRLVEVGAGAHLDGAAGAAGELWFVLAGSGRLDVADGPGLTLRRDHGVWIPPASRYALRPGQDGELRLDAVALPGPAPGRAGAGPAAGPGVPIARSLPDCDVETTGDRRFRVLFGPGRGCAVATQFVGEIPPGRAPDHSHPYDELVLVLDGVGTAHIADVAHPVSPGTCLHLPPGLRHCLENTGTSTMRVLGVFHPADSPASKLEATG